MKRLLATVLLAGLAATSAHAVLGETLAQLTARMGKPESTSRKDAAVWFFEVEAGRVVYTVTLNDKNVSIAEGVKPLKQAVFGKASQDFINAQLTLTKDSKTVRNYEPGQTYTVDGKPYTCGPDEYVTVDEAVDFILVWNRSRAPSVIAFRKEMLGK